LLLSFSAFSQNIIKTVGISYTNGSPTYTPAKAGSALALDTVTWRYYTWNGSTWLSDGFRVQTISGCSAPAYTPTKYQSLVVINACNDAQGGPEIYKWSGSVWEKSGGTAYTAGTGIDITGTVITNTAPNVVQTLSIAGQDLTLSNGGGTVLIPGGSGATAANNGVSLSSTTVQLGDASGGTSSQFTANRFLPQNNFGLFAGNNAMTSYVRIAGDSFATSGILNFKFPAAAGTAFSKVINPIVKGTQNAPFYEGISSTAQSGNSPNAVWMAGWNLSPGGAKVESGKPYIGESWEHNYRPGSPTVYPRLVEKHEIYMPSYSNVQRRLSSYTISESETGANVIDYYHTVDAFRLRDTSGIDYFSILGNNSSASSKTSSMTQLAGDKVMRISIDSLNNLFTIANISGTTQKLTSNFTWTGFREYHFNDYLGRSVFQNVSFPTFNAIDFGTTSHQSEIYFKTSNGTAAWGTHFETNANTTSNLTTRGNIFLNSGSNVGVIGQRSDINMLYIGTAGSSAIRSTCLQVGPNAGGSLPSGSALNVLGAGNTSSTYSVIVTNSSGASATATLALRDDGIVGFGTNAPNTSAKVEISSTTSGFLPPRMTTAQRDAIASPATGLTLYCTDCTATDASKGVMQTYNGAAWKNNW